MNTRTPVIAAVLLTAVIQSSDIVHAASEETTEPAKHLGVCVKGGILYRPDGSSYPEPLLGESSTIHDSSGALIATCYKRRGMHGWERGCTGPGGQPIDPCK